ncbi:MAG TPA: class I SAM-dependent methyltransferase [Candidatus Saccharimonadales bacterium]|nr:class I SAM-dependent methyltransferase [Candidatus Saccharimonadales bacterium]
MATKHRKADQYNDPNHNYLKYWEGREYENAAEEIAIGRLLKKKHFGHAVDVGGGYGRLCVFLEQFADKVTLAEPSQQQLDIAKDFLKDHPEIDRKLLQADDLKFKDGSVDLLTMVRVMHHLPDPTPEFKEINRVLAKDGVFILELANNAHGRNRVKYALKGKGIPAQPVDIRSPEHQSDEEIPFVNHHPRTVINQLRDTGFKVEKVLSVSNLRSTTIKKFVPHSVMLSVEKLLQPSLALTYFGPSIFFLVRKKK